MKTYIKSAKVFILLFFVVAIIATFFATFSIIDYSDYINPHRLVVERVWIDKDGSKYQYYCSGDSNYNFMHDSSGYLLEVNDDSLYYAKSDRGIPVPTNNKYKGISTPPMSAMHLSQLSQENYVQEPQINDNIENKLLLNTSGNQTINNILIYIAFRGETVNLVNDPYDHYFNGETNSVKHYFTVQSQGHLTINTITPQDNEMIYVYTDSQSRDYYNVKEGILTNNTRGVRESTLLTNAVKACDQYISTEGIDIDINDDDNLDSVNFVVSGSRIEDWGNLLWPHSANLKEYNAYYNKTQTAKIGGVFVGDYAFNFVNSLDVGVLSHETAHVLGVPDLYHYDDAYAPVGAWDIMGSTNKTPQYMTTYIRDRYIGGIKDNQIADIIHNGVYSLNTVNSASDKDILAYKIPTNNPQEYIMVEYRSNTSELYDSDLPSSGLIIYRVRESVTEGNRNARYNKASSPDEVFVYRPKVKFESNKLATSHTDMQYANLSPVNNYFKTVGSSTSNTKYDSANLYYSNGENCGIVIQTISIGERAISFNVKVNTNNNIDDNYFDDKFTLLGTQAVNNSTLSGVETNIDIGSIDKSYLANLSLQLLDSNDSLIASSDVNLSQFQKEYPAQTRFKVSFAVNAKGNDLTTIFSAPIINGNLVPSKIVVKCTDADGDAKTVAEGSVSYNGLSWADVLSTRAKIKSQLVSSKNATFGITNSSEVYSIGKTKDGQWNTNNLSNIIGVASGETHTLFLSSSLTVVSRQKDALYNENNVGWWENIIQVEAGQYSSFGLTTTGKVIATGKNIDDQYKANLDNWDNVTSISAGYNHLLGLKTDGTVYGIKSGIFNEVIDVASWSNIVSISAGKDFSAGLTSLGTVLVTGDLADKEQVQHWRDIVAISAGEKYILGLTSDGRVLAVGDNSYNQCDTRELFDIVEISAGSIHSAYLRKDGKVVFRGSNLNSTIGEIPNLYTKNYINPTEISLNYPKDSIAVGVTLAPEVKVTPTNSSYNRVLYSVDNPHIATVDELSGIITPLAPGACIITAKIPDSGVLSTFNLEVTQYIPPESIVLKNYNLTLSLGSKANISASINPIDASIYSNIQYSSQNTNIATIDKNGLITAVTMGRVEIVATFTQNGITLTAKCQVTVSGKIKNIELISSPKLEYRFGESLDLSNGKIKVTTESSETVIALTEDMVSLYNPNLLGSQNVKISYGDVEIDFQVKVVNYPISIAVKSLPKTKYLYDEPFDTTEGTFDVEFADGSYTTVILANATISGFNNKRIGTQTIQLNYQNLTTTLDIEVIDYVKYIRSNNIEKIGYNAELPPDHIVTLIKASGEEANTYLSQCTYSGFQNKVFGIHNVEISYNDAKHNKTTTTTIMVNVEDNITLNIIKDRHIYQVGEELELEIFANFASGYSQKINTSGDIYYFLKNFDKNKNGGYIVILEIYLSKNTWVNGEIIKINTFNNSMDLNVEGVEPITNLIIKGKTEYQFGEPIELLVIATGDSGEYEVTPTFIEYDSNLLDTKQFYTVKYLNLQAHIEIIIRDYMISINLPDNVKLLYGEYLSLPQITINMASGKLEIADNTKFSTFSYDNKKIGLQTIMLNYQGLEVEIKIEVVDAITSVLQTTPPKTIYNYGEELDLSLARYLVTYLSGRIDTIPFDKVNFAISTFKPTEIGRQTLTIRHTSTFTEWKINVEVKNYIVELSLSANSTLDYKFNQDLSVIVIAKFANNITRNLKTDEYTSNYNKTLLGNQAIILTTNIADIKNGVLEFEVKVVDVLKSVEEKSKFNKLRYYYGEALDYNGGEVIFSYMSGNVMTIKNDEFGTLTNNFDPLKPGVQKVKFIHNASGSIEIDITVLAKPKSYISTKNLDIKIDTNNNIILLRPFTTKELIDTLTALDYLNLKINVSEETYACHLYRVELYNKNAFLIEKYNIYLIGDGNYDGLITDDDISYLAMMLLNNENNDTITGDINGDGKFTLSDLVGFATQNKEKQAPNKFFKIFIANIKEDIDEESI